jgi:hypothetical protein
MTPFETALLAISLMGEHGLRPTEPGGCRFEFDTARRRAGCCHWRADGTAERITLSAPIMALWEEPAVRDIILHEVAHALCGPGAHHGFRWRQMCMRIGANPSRTYDEDLPQLPKRWVGVCPQGHATERDRLPAHRKVSCARCDSRGYNPRFLFVWKRND